MVSIFSQHFFNWTLQLKDQGHEIYWIDVYDSNTYVKKIDFVHQTIGWKNKIKYPGRYKVKQYFPQLNRFINKVNQKDFLPLFKEKLEEINPDVVHSFVMYSACVPILEVMKEHPHIKWVFSAWGNDIYYYKDQPKELHEMKQVFPHLDYMFADCTRDYLIAKGIGFRGEYLGTFPTGGGYDFDHYDPFIQNYSSRKIILVKGYQHKFGRCNIVLNTLLELKDKLQNFEIVVFAAHQAVFDHVDQAAFRNFKNLTVKGNIGREEVLQLMGKSAIYIGNSISDGTPNTLLEAIIMGAFPIQSDPGGATSEIIENGKNGLIIEDAEDVEGIKNQILRALQNVDFREEAVEYNFQEVKPKLERKKIEKEVRKKYSYIQHNLST